MEQGLRGDIELPIPDYSGIERALADPGFHPLAPTGGELVAKDESPYYHRWALIGEAQNRPLLVGRTLVETFLIELLP
jgi:hypothetical protein